MATEQPAVARRHAIREKLETRLISEPLRGKMLDFIAPAADIARRRRIGSAV